MGKSQFINYLLLQAISNQDIRTTIKPDSVTKSDLEGSKKYFINFELGIDPVSHDTYVYKTMSGRDSDFNELLIQLGK